MSTLDTNNSALEGENPHYLSALLGSVETYPTTTVDHNPHLPNAFLYHKASHALKLAGLGQLNYLTDEPGQLPTEHLPYMVTQPLLRDMAKAEVPARYHLRTRDLHRATQIAQQLGLQVVIIGALTSATENFGAPGVEYDSDKIIAIEAEGVPDSSQIKQSIDGDYALSNEVHIDLKNGTLRAGAGLTPDQLNELLPAGKWLAVDATTRGQLKAVLPTGPMGPARIRPSEVIEEVKLTDGTTIKVLQGPEVEQHEGLLGITGGVVETTYKILDVPKEKFGVFAALNVQTLDPENTNWDEELANVLAHLYPALNLRINGNRLESDWSEGYLDGVEIITENELQFLLEDQVAVSDEIKTQARTLLANLKQANSKYGLFITGRAEKNFSTLTESTTPDNPINTMLTLLETAEMSDVIEIPPAKMKGLYQLREDIPTAAKSEAAPEQPDPEILRASFTTDFVTTISASAREQLNALYGGERIDFLRANIRRQLTPHLARQKVFARMQRENNIPELKLRNLSYGHGHIRGLDLHDRETLIANLKGLSPERRAIVIAAFMKNKERAKTEANGALKEGMARLATDPNTTQLSGEKGKLPEFDTLSPSKKDEVADLVKAAPPVFSWRAVGSKVWNYIQARNTAAA